MQISVHFYFVFACFVYSTIKKTVINETYGRFIFRICAMCAYHLAAVDAIFIANIAAPVRFCYYYCCCCCCYWETHTCIYNYFSLVLFFLHRNNSLRLSLQLSFLNYSHSFRMQKKLFLVRLVHKTLKNCISAERKGKKQKIEARLCALNALISPYWTIVFFIILKLGFDRVNWIE